MANSMSIVGGTVALLAGVFVGGWMADLLGEEPRGRAGRDPVGGGVVHRVEDPQPARPAPAPRDRGPRRGRRVLREFADRITASPTAGRSDRSPRSRSTRWDRASSSCSRCSCSATASTRVGSFSNLIGAGGVGVLLGILTVGKLEERFAKERIVAGGVPDRRHRARPRRDDDHRLERAARELRGRPHVRVEEDPRRHDGQGDPRRLPGPRVRRVRRRVQPVQGDRGLPRDPDAERPRRGLVGRDRGLVFVAWSPSFPAGSAGYSSPCGSTRVGAPRKSRARSSGAASRRRWTSRPGPSRRRTGSGGCGTGSACGTAR